MCGIVGYNGVLDAKEILLKGLEKLEYRGYDSAGIAVHNEEGVTIFKEKGRIADLRKAVDEDVELGVQIHDFLDDLLVARIHRVGHREAAAEVDGAAEGVVAGEVGRGAIIDGAVGREDIVADDATVELIGLCTTQERADGGDPGKLGGVGL